MQRWKGQRRPHDPTSGDVVFVTVPAEAKDEEAQKEEDDYTDTHTERDQCVGEIAL